MATQNSCHGCCLSRRQCIQMLSLSALGAGLARPLLQAAETKPAPPYPDFIDPAKLRPNPEVKIAATFLEQPRPFWLGWPGTTYDLDGHQKEYRTSWSSRPSGSA